MPWGLQVKPLGPKLWESQRWKAAWYVVKKKLDSEATVQTLKVVKTSYDSDCAHAAFASKEEADLVRRTLNNEPFTYEEYLEEEPISCITDSGQEYRKQGRRHPPKKEVEEDEGWLFANPNKPKNYKNWTKKPKTYTETLVKNMIPQNKRITVYYMNKYLILLIPLVQWRWVFGSTNSGSMQQEELEEEKEDEVPSDAEAPEGDSEGQ